MATCTKCRVSSSASSGKYGGRDHRDRVGPDLERVRGERAVSAVVCAPAWTATWNPSGRAVRNDSAIRRRSSIDSSTPSPVVPHASSPSTPPSATSEPHERRERVVVEMSAAVAQGRHGGGDRSTQLHGGGVYSPVVQNTFRSASSVLATGFSAMRRMNHGYQYGPYAISVRTVYPSRASRRCSSERIP